MRHLEAHSLSMTGRLLITPESASLRLELMTPKVQDFHGVSIAQNRPLFILETPLPKTTAGPLRELLNSQSCIHLQGSLPPAINGIVKSFCGWYSEHFGTTTPDFSTLVVNLSPTSSDGKSEAPTEESK